MEIEAPVAPAPAAKPPARPRQEVKPPVGKVSTVHVPLLYLHRPVFYTLYISTLTHRHFLFILKKMFYFLGTLQM